MTAIAGMAGQEELQLDPTQALVSYPDGRWGSLPVTTYRGPVDRFRELLPAFEERPLRLVEHDGRWSAVNPTLRGIVRSDTRVPVAVVSTHYQLVQHRDLYDEIVRALRTIAGKVPLEGTMSLTRDGERMELTVLMPAGEEYAFHIGDDDDMRFRITCFNSVDGGAKLMLVAGWLRFVCSNGLVIGRRVLSVRERHSRGLEFSRVARELGNVAAQVAQGRQLCQGWRDTATGEDAIRRWADGPLSKAWGVKAAARTYHVCMTGRDFRLTDPFERGLPTERSGEPTDYVPGAARPAKNLFEVAQALSWVAGQRTEHAARLDGTEEISGLLRELQRSAYRRRN